MYTQCIPNWNDMLWQSKLLCILLSDFRVQEYGTISGKAVENGIWKTNWKGRVDFTKLIGGDILGRPSEITPFGGVCLTQCTQWPKSGSFYTIPYTIQASFSSYSKNLIRYEMDYIENSTDIRFVVRTTQTNYLNIVKTNECSSYVGMVGGAQVRL